MEGWIKLYRQLLKSPIFENEKALKVWIWCLCKASHEERDQLVGRQMIHLKKGQFVTGRKKAGEELKMKDRTVYDYFMLLKNMGMLNIESNTKFSVVSIENWEEYQIQEEKSNNKNNNSPTTSQHKQECKEIYLYYINKYKGESRRTFYEKMRFLRLIKEDEMYGTLSPDEEYELREMILNEVI